MLAWKIPSCSRFTLNLGTELKAYIIYDLRSGLQFTNIFICMHGFVAADACGVGAIPLPSRTIGRRSDPMPLIDYPPLPVSSVRPSLIHEVLVAVRIVVHRW
jgi:hypothetical protein